MQHSLEMGWAVTKRMVRRLNDKQKNFLNMVFDKGERTSSKATPENTLMKMRQGFNSTDYLPLSTIKSYLQNSKKDSPRRRYGN